MLAHSFERENSDSEGDASKVETRKRKHRVHAYFRKNRKRSIPRSEEYGDLTKSLTKNVNLGTITDMLPWYKFSPLSGILVKPKPHRRRRRIYERLQKKSQKAKVTYTDKSSEFGMHCEELSWNHRTTTLHQSALSLRNKRNCRTS